MSGITGFLSLSYLWENKWTTAASVAFPISFGGTLYEFIKATRGSDKAADCNCLWWEDDTIPTDGPCAGMNTTQWNEFCDKLQNVNGLAMEIFWPCLIVTCASGYQLGKILIRRCKRAREQRRYEVIADPPKPVAASPTSSRAPTAAGNVEQAYGEL